MDFMRKSSTFREMSFVETGEGEDEEAGVVSGKDEKVEAAGTDGRGGARLPKPSFIEKCQSPWSSNFARSKALSIETQRSIQVLRKNAVAVINELQSQNRKKASRRASVKGGRRKSIVGKANRKLTLSKRVEQELDETIELIESLPRVQYDVVKCGKYKRKLKRRLTLETDKLVNSYRNGTITKSFPYGQIVDAMLVNHARLRLQFMDYHDLYYQSNSAPKIMSDIQVRLEIVKQILQKQEQLEVISNFAKHMGVWGVMDEGMVGKICSPDLTQRTRISRKGKSRPDRRLSRVEKMAELAHEGDAGMEQQARAFVHKIVHDEATDEGRTRLDFINNANGLFEKAFADADKIRQGGGAGRGGSDEADEERLAIIIKPLTTVRQFVEGMKQYILGNHSAEIQGLLKLSESYAASEHEGSENDPEAESEELNLVVTKCAEDSMVRPLYSLILKTCNAIVSKETSTQWRHAYGVLCTKSQEFFEIKKEFIDSENWHDAVLHCSDVGIAKLPTEKLEALLDAVHAIYNRFKVLNPDEKSVLGADDFLPIFMYVLSRSGLDCAFHDKEFMVNLSPILTGEGAYYISTLEAALAYMINMVEG
jgi:hypothetical protein